MISWDKITLFSDWNHKKVLQKRDLCVSALSLPLSSSHQLPHHSLPVLMSLTFWPGHIQSSLVGTGDLVSQLMVQGVILMPLYLRKHQALLSLLYGTPPSHPSGSSRLFPQFARKAQFSKLSLEPHGDPQINRGPGLH